MLVIILLWILRQYRAAGNLKECLKLLKYQLKTNFTNKIIVFISIIFSLTASAQERKLNYEVIHNGNLVGHLNVQQSNEGAFIHLKAESEVKSRIIFMLTLLAKEETIFNNGVLIFSSMKRKLNGREKTNIQVKLEGSTYQVNNEGSLSQLVSGPIYYNLLSMYVKEPKLFSKAYSDNFMEFVPIQRTGVNQYKVTLPDGNYNNYFYKDDVCTKVEIHHTLYSLIFLLTNNKK